MTDGGYTFEEWMRMHGRDPNVKQEPSPPCSKSAEYDGNGPTPCWPPCSPCFDKEISALLAGDAQEQEKGNG